MRRMDPIGVRAGRGLAMWAVLLVMLAGMAAIAAAPADAAVITYEGSFSRPDGGVRCTLAASWAQCVSVTSGRVAGVNRDGTTESYFTKDAIARGRRVKGHTLVNTTGTIACRAGARYISCFVLKWGSSFTQDAHNVMTSDLAGVDFIDDSVPVVAPTPAG